MTKTIEHNHRPGEPCNALACPVAAHTSHPHAAPIREAWPAADQAIEQLARRGVLYTLAADGRTPVPATGAEFETWYLTADRIVRQERVAGVVVSTVFLGIDHTFGLGRLELWETTVFAPEGVTVARRYATYEDAERGHSECVRARAAAYLARE